MKKPTKSEPHNWVSTEDTTDALCARKESELLVTQGIETFKFGNTISEMTDALAPKVLFEVSPVEVAFFPNAAYKYDSASETKVGGALHNMLSSYT